MRGSTKNVGVAVSDLSRALDRFVPCEWRCERCHKSGTVKPWQRAGESKAQAVHRHARETRALCVGGCTYSAFPRAVRSRASGENLT